LSDSEILAIADSFVKGYYAGDIQVITPPEDAISQGDKVMDMARISAHQLMRGEISEAIHNHLTKKSLDTARVLVKKITGCRSAGMIVEGETYISKAKRLEKENSELKAENTKLQKTLEKKEKLIEQLQTIINAIRPTKRNDDEGMNP
jgi:predicted RNase H-like nuclease (RuvC/YqgF family)